MRAGDCSLRVSRDNHIHVQLVWCFLYRCRSNYVTLSCSQYRTVVYRGGDRSRNTRLKRLSDKVYTTMLNMGRHCVLINAVHTMAGVHAPAAEIPWKNELESLLAEHEDIIKQHPDAGGVIL